MIPLDRVPPTGSTPVAVGSAPSARPTAGVDLTVPADVRTVPSG